MQEYPKLPTVADAPADLLDGHLWLQEWMDGGPLRFRMEESGLLRFGDRTSTFDAADAPLPYRHAVRHVREAFDRDALRAAADDPSAVTFYGVATFRRGVDYDWARTPPFLGFDAWSGDRDAFLPPDVVERALDRLGLRPVNALAREVRAADFHPDRYEFPASAWRDGPAAGVVVRNKRGGRAKLPNPAVGAEAGGDPERVDADALAEAHVTRDRVEREARPGGAPRNARAASEANRDREARQVADDERAAGSDAVVQRVLEAVAREHAHRLRDGRVDGDALREAVGSRARALLDGS